MSTQHKDLDTFQRRLSPTARQVLLLLQRTADVRTATSQLTDREISQNVGKAIRTVQYAIHDLRRAGLIRCDLYSSTGTRRVITLL